MIEIKKNRFALRAALLALILLFALVDVGIVAWSARVVTGPQLAAAVSAGLLIATGMLVTAYSAER